MLLDGGILSLCSAIRTNSLLNSLLRYNPARSFSCISCIMIPCNRNIDTDSSRNACINLMAKKKKCIFLQKQNKTLTRTQSDLWIYPVKACPGSPLCCPRGGDDCFLWYSCSLTEKGKLRPPPISLRLLCLLLKFLRSLLRGNLMLFPRNKSAEILPATLLEGMQQVNVGPSTLQPADT